MMLLTIIICAALAIVLFSADVSWSNVLSQKRNDLVFESRNKEYGAYLQRQEQPRNLFIAFLLSSGLLAAFGFSYLHFVRPVSKSFEFPTVPVDISDILPPIPKETKPEQDQGVKPRSTLPTRKPIAGLSTPVVVTETPPQPSGHLFTTGGSPDGEPDEGFQPPYEPAGNGSGGAQPAAETTPVIPDFSQIMPEFPGGEPKLYRFISENVPFPERLREINGEATVYVSFVVTYEGKVTMVEIIRGIPNETGLDKSIIKAFENMPLWKPGRNGTKHVSVRMRVPIRFKTR
ncbi:MAG: energy transducer TonB [Flavobacteriales bacterium]|jgi:protein TonB